MIGCTASVPDQALRVQGSSTPEAVAGCEDVGVRIVRLDHVQLTMPPGREADAVGFYEGLLGLPQVPKPPHLAVRGGCWFEQGDVKVHVGVEQGFRPARKAHPALIVDGLGDLIAALRSAGVRVVDGEPLEGYQRVDVEDPFGNRIELMEPHR